jgi:hypothetical protein
VVDVIRDRTLGRRRHGGAADGELAELGLRAGDGRSHRRILEGNQMSQSMKTQIYGYKRFTPAEYDFTEDVGLKAGDQHRDMDLYTLDGSKVRLSDYLGSKPLVLETGSMTCPMYAQSADPMQDLIRKYPNLDCLLLYVREAHPGGRRPQHRSLEDKIGAACQTKQRYHEETRPILVDDLNGSAHRYFGSMPNSIFIIAPDGKVISRSIWNNTIDIDLIFSKLASDGTVTSHELKAVPPFSCRGIRTPFYGGVVALWDFIVGLPRLIANHKKVGNM